MLWKSGHLFQNCGWRPFDAVPALEIIDGERVRRRIIGWERFSMYRSVRISNISSTGQRVESQSLRWRNLSQRELTVGSRADAFHSRNFRLVASIIACDTIRLAHSRCICIPTHEARNGLPNYCPVESAEIRQSKECNKEIHIKGR